MSNARIGELERRLSNTIRPGKVLEADYAKARLRVTMGDNTSAWLPWLTSRAGEDRTWHAPEVGEQVIVIAPGGELMLRTATGLERLIQADEIRLVAD